MCRSPPRCCGHHPTAPSPGSLVDTGHKAEVWNWQPSHSHTRAARASCKQLVGDADESLGVARGEVGHSRSEIHASTTSAVLSRMGSAFRTGGSKVTRR